MIELKECIMSSCNAVEIFEMECAVSFSDFADHDSPQFPFSINCPLP